MADKVTYEQFQDMNRRVQTFITNNGRPPLTVDILEIKTKSELKQQLETALGGTFNTITEAYNLVKNNKYSHYSNDVYNYKEELERLNQKAGLNCADFSQICNTCLVALNQEGKKYNARFVHVKCKRSDGTVNQNAGHFFMEVSGEELGNGFVIVDFAEAASGKKPINSTMCKYGFKVVGYNPQQLLVDDGEF